MEFIYWITKDKGCGSVMVSHYKTANFFQSLSDLAMKPV